MNADNQSVFGTASVRFAAGGVLALSSVVTGGADCRHAAANPTLAREDARGLGSAALARHPNPYVRIESLRRMEAHAAQLDDAEVAAAAAALEDETLVFDESCRRILEGPGRAALCPVPVTTPGASVAKLRIPPRCTPATLEIRSGWWEPCPRVRGGPE